MSFKPQAGKWYVIAFNEDEGAHEIWEFESKQAAVDFEPRLPVKYSYPQILTADKLLNHSAWHDSGWSANPKGRKMATKKPSAAQLAARQRFAEMARSGAFKKKATKRKANPLTRVKVNSPPQRGGDLTPRLVKRRKATKKAPPGYYANPMPKGRQYLVARPGGPVIAVFSEKKKAVEYAQALADKIKSPVSVHSR